MDGLKKRKRTKKKEREREMIPKVEGERKRTLPVGPFRLSIQPGRGSCSAAVTIDGRTMANGMSPHSLSRSCSANALV